jgi:prepilin-type N-terminal cleavage/methylation domain-containing protein
VTAPVTNPHRSTRRGFTLIEVLISLAVLGIIGVGMVRLLMSQSRFAEGQMSLRNARTVSRNAMNIMLTDLRMVQDNGGLIAASQDSITVRVPVAFGLLCTTSGSPIVSLLPADSAMTALAQYAGWAYREATLGTYVYMDAATPAAMSTLSPANATACTDSTSGPGILSMTFTPKQSTASRSTRIVSLPDQLIAASNPVPDPGTPMFVYQQITYKFAASTAYPSRRGLFRILKTNNPAQPVRDEIVAPFDSASARFRFYVVGADAAQSDVPPLNTVRGVELVLAGSSPRKPQDRELAQQALVTGVFFMNRTNTNVNQ